MYVLLGFVIGLVGVPLFGWVAGALIDRLELDDGTGNNDTDLETA